MKPTYIGIGAQKCASSWLHKILADHPQVGVSEKKEVDFFSHHYDYGYRWYERQFAACGGKDAVGEISPSYFCSPGVPERVARYLPDAKILVSFREPVERALSNHRHEVRMGRALEGEPTFEAGLANNPMYVEQGLYATHYKRWLEYFPPSQILVVLMDDVIADPLAVAKQVYAFVGVDPSHRPTQLTEKANRSYVNRSRRLSSVKDELYALTRSPSLRWLWSFASALGVKSLYRRANVMESDVKIPAPAEQTLAELRRRFEPEVRELAVLIGRPLDSWM